MIPALSHIMETFLKRKSITYNKHRARTTKTEYMCFKLKSRNYVLRVSDHDQDSLNYDFSVKTVNDIGRVQHRISQLLGR